MSHTHQFRASCLLCNCILWVCMSLFTLMKRKRQEEKINKTSIYYYKRMTFFSTFMLLLHVVFIHLLFVASKLAIICVTFYRVGSLIFRMTITITRLIYFFPLFFF